jgi:arylsulfatase A-like enzyme
VLIVLIDDAGFGGPDTFGGEIRTPTLTRVQQMGLTYNRFHVTAVCSPTRAALLTGRNHHRVGMGGIAEFPGPFPGYTGTRPRSCTALPRILKENGYKTGGLRQVAHDARSRDGPSRAVRPLAARVGLRPLVGLPDRRRRPVRPDHHPGQLDARRARGRGRQALLLPRRHHRQGGRVAPRCRAHDATRRGSCTTRPGATTRRTTSPRSGPTSTRASSTTAGTPTASDARAPEALGIVPPDTELADRPDLFPAWDTLSDAEKTLYARQMEVFAGFSENADWNVGRLLDAIEEMGDLDNTLIFYIWGDNGASMEGTLTGSFNETTFFNGVVLDADEQLALIEKFGGIEELGGEHTAPHFAAAWAHANNTPFPWGKQMASHLGGDRDPMVVAWPNRIKAGRRPAHAVHPLHRRRADDPRAHRHPRAHLGRRHRAGADGRHELRLHVRRPDAAERHTVQYFEMYGSRAIYQDGWWACARLDKAPWDFSPATLQRFAPGSGYDPDQDDWELYYLPDDFSPGEDIAAEHPEKLAELKELFWQEAERNRALPLLGGLAAFFGILPPMPT